MPRTIRRALTAAAIVAACTLAMRADTARGDAELQFQLANLLFDETRYREALQAFDRAIAVRRCRRWRSRARKGKVRTALRIAEFGAGAARKRNVCAPTAPPTPRR